MFLGTLGFLWVASGVLWWAGPSGEGSPGGSRHQLTLCSQRSEVPSVFSMLGNSFCFVLFCFLRKIVPLKASGQQNEIMSWLFLLFYLAVFSQYAPCPGQAQNSPHLTLTLAGSPTHLGLGNFSQVLTCHLTNFSTWHFSFFPLCFLVWTFALHCSYMHVSLSLKLVRFLRTSYLFTFLCPEPRFQ